MQTGATRIARELRDLRHRPEDYFYVFPDPKNPFCIHFTLIGFPGTDFDTGMYHGKIEFKLDYPLSPPSFRFLGPESGRFSLNTYVCTTFSNYHPECWKATWSLRQILIGLHSFLSEDSPGSVGSIEASAEVRRSLASRSHEYRCPECSCDHVKLWPIVSKKLDSLREKLNNKSDKKLPTSNGECQSKNNMENNISEIRTDTSSAEIIKTEGSSLPMTATTSSEPFTVAVESKDNTDSIETSSTRGYSSATITSTANSASTAPITNNQNTATSTVLTEKIVMPSKTTSIVSLLNMNQNMLENIVATKMVSQSNLDSAVQSQTNGMYIYEKNPSFVDGNTTNTLSSVTSIYNNLDNTIEQRKQMMKTEITDNTPMIKNITDNSLFKLSERTQAFRDSTIVEETNSFSNENTFPMAGKNYRAVMVNNPKAILQAIGCHNITTITTNGKGKQITNTTFKQNDNDEVEKLTTFMTQNKLCWNLPVNQNGSNPFITLSPTTQAWIRKQYSAEE